MKTFLLYFIPDIASLLCFCPCPRSKMSLLPILPNTYLLYLTSMYFPIAIRNVLIALEIHCYQYCMDFGILSPLFKLLIFFATVATNFNICRNKFVAIS